MCSAKTHPCLGGQGGSIRPPPLPQGCDKFLATFASKLSHPPKRRADLCRAGRWGNGYGVCVLELQELHQLAGVIGGDGVDLQFDHALLVAGGC